MKKVHVLLISLVFVFTCLACGGGGGSSESTQTPTPTENNLISPPSYLNAVVVDSDTVNLLWQSVSSAEKYRIYRYIASSSSFETYWDVSSANTSCSDNFAFSEGIAYCYAITSFNTQGIESISSTESQTVTPNPQPTSIDAPSNLYASVLNSTTVQLSWTTVSGATGYVIYRYRSGVSTPDSSIQISSSLSSYQDQYSFVQGTSYYYGIISKLNLIGSDTETKSGTVTPNPQPSELPPPSTLSTTLVSNSEADISWTTVSGATGYEVQRIRSGFSVPDETWTVSSSTTSINDAFSFIQGIEYCYSISTINDTVVGSTKTYSDVIMPFPYAYMITAPDSLSSLRDDDVVNLSWSTVPNVTGYVLKKYSSDGSTPISTWNLPATQSTYQDDSTFEEYVEYYYTICSLIGSVESSEVDQTDPILVKVGHHMSSVAIHTVCLRSNGEVYTWGGNPYGQIGNGNTGGNYDSPQHLSFFDDKNVIWTSSGWDFSMVLCNNGDVYAWGRNNYNQLGLGDAVDRTSPTIITTLSGKNVVRIVSGDCHSYAITSSNEVYAWGRNDRAQLGLGHRTTVHTPTKISLFDSLSVKEISACQDSNCALLENGDIYSWGWGEEYQLGNASDEKYVLVPTKISSFATSKVIGVAMGAYHCLAICMNGETYSWGSSSDGALGRGTVTSATTPTILSSYSSSLKTGVFATHGSSYVLCQDGKIYAWGSNYSGQLGLGSRDDVSSPTLISDLSGKTITGFFAAQEWAYAIDDDETLYAWGENSNGQLGINSSIDKTRPTGIVYF